MSIREVFVPLQRWTAAGRDSAVATLLRVERSAPRRPGARYAVSASGDEAGSISEGCVEADLRERLLRTLATGAGERVTYGLTDAMAAEVGLACGGTIEVLVAPHRSGPAWEAIGRVVEAEEAAVLLTRVEDPGAGRQWLVRPDGRVVGDAEGGGGLDAAARAAAATLLEEGGARLLSAREGGGELFAEAVWPPPRLAVVGAGPVGRALAALAPRVGFRVVVIDPREGREVDTAPPAVRRLVAWPDEGLAALGIDRWWSVAVVAHDEKLDVPALEAALESGCRYVGLLGGSRTRRERKRALAEAGVAQDDLERIRSPIGLAIGAETPEEIALAVVAELVAERRGGERAGAAAAPGDAGDGTA